MKKLLTLNLFLAVIGAILVAICAIPSFDIYATDGTLLTNMNLFVATFGGSVTATEWAANPIVLTLCPGLLVSFILLVVSVVLNLLRYKVKAASLFASLTYVAAGVLLFTSLPLLEAANFNVTLSEATYNFAILATPIVIGVLECVLGLFSICDSAVVLSKK